MVFVDFGKNTKAYGTAQFQIDQEDYEKYLKDKTCYLSKGYVLLNNKGIHRIIMDVTDPKLQVDHINHDPLDNRRCNLRVATPQQNSYNKNVFKNNTTGYTGVHLYKPTGKYMAYIKADNKRKHLGYYETLEEAYTAYVRASKELHGEYAPERVKEMEVEPLEPKPKEYKSPKWAIENYKKNRDVKLKKQILRNIRKTGKTPKDSTIEKHKITQAEISENLEIFQKNS